MFLLDLHYILSNSLMNFNAFQCFFYLIVKVNITNRWSLEKSMGKSLDWGISFRNIISQTASNQRFSIITNFNIIRKLHMISLQNCSFLKYRSLALIMPKRSPPKQHLIEYNTSWPYIYFLTNLRILLIKWFRR